uniref:Cytochrome P450 oxidase CYP72D18 n=1 Tax=Polygala tenuifolia TaxID=355332 RepID=A0A3G5AQ78_9FABA|nr:cytochrome P450 oxidase CYP72D18 [Polygala tenuifolia]
MDCHFSSLFLIASLFLLFLYGAARVFYSIWWRPKQLEKHLKMQGISGTPYRPLIADMKEFVKLISEAWSKPMNLNHQIVSRVDPFTLKNVNTYGKISMCWNGTTPRLIVKNPELMKEILSNKQGHFGKPYLNPLILILTKGITTLEGEDWSRRRRTLNPAFHLEKLKEMLPVFSTSCNQMIEQWKRKPGPQGTFVLDIWPEFQRLSADVISKAAFGSSYEEGKRIFELLKELMTLVIEAMQTLYIPGFRFVPTKKNLRRKKLDKEIRSMVRNLIESKEDSMIVGEGKVDNLLGILLQANKENNNYHMTMEEVIEECKQFYLAGQETTSSLLTWTVIVLAMHPDWQEKARLEILEICKGEEPDFEALAHFKIINMITMEVLRLYPPAIAHYQHAYKETRIGHISLPAGVDVTLPTLLIHHDPELWGNDAEEFRPERFSEGVSRASKSSLAFFPFGWGPRTCIGQNFALIEAKIALAKILQNFSFKLSPSYIHAPYTVMTLQPQHGAEIEFNRI